MVNVLNNKKYKKVYLSGRITGMPNKNKEQFEYYENRFKELGFEVINPHKIFSEDFVNDLKNKLLVGSITTEQFWAAFMIPDVINMLGCDFIAALPEWNLSKGASIEIKLAKDLYMPVVDANSLTEI